MEIKYYESHVTLAPVLEPVRLQILRDLASKHSFRVADLLMNKNGKFEQSTKDSFATARGKSYDELFAKMNNFSEEAKSLGFEIWRNKIEGVIYDQRF